MLDRYFADAHGNLVAVADMPTEMVVAQLRAMTAQGDIPEEVLERYRIELVIRELGL